MVIAMRVFYLDSFFVLNLFLDYLLILLTAKLSNVAAKRSRILLASGIGSLFAIWMFFFSGKTWIHLVLSIAFAWVIISLSFSQIEKRKRIKLMGIFWMESYVFSGVMMLLQNYGVGKITVKNGITYLQLELWQVIVSAVFACVFLKMSFRDYSLKLEKKRLRIRAELKDACIETVLLVDSGNLLREPLSGKAIILLAPDLAEKLLPCNTLEWKNKGAFDASSLMQLLVDLDVPVRILPLYTASGASSITLAFKADRLFLETNGVLKETTDYWIGIAKSDIDVCGGCRGLIGI